jgi:hypothetical protein
VGGLIVAVIAFAVVVDAKRARESEAADDPTTLAENRTPAVRR